MRQQNPWTTAEYRVLKEEFLKNANVSARELHALLPRHTEKSIGQKWVELGFARPDGAKRHKPGWAAVAKALENGPQSRQEIADKLGCTRSNVQAILAPMRAHWHIAGYRPSGHYAVMTPLIGLGAGEDAAYPKGSTQNKCRVSSPFSVAAGVIKPIEVASVRGRIYHHLWDDHDREAA